MHASNRCRTLLIGAWLVLMTGCANTDQQVEQAPRAEAVLETRVKSALLEVSDLGAAAITVRKQENGILLTGFVESQEKSRQAEEVAAGVDGVKSVTNQLEVKY